jgi:hypothetical protein
MCIKVKAGKKNHTVLQGIKIIAKHQKVFTSIFSILMSALGMMLLNTTVQISSHSMLPNKRPKQ